MRIIQMKVLVMAYILHGLLLWYYCGTIMAIEREGECMPQIIPIKELKNTSEISELCHSVMEPIYVTKNGYGDMVIMSMETFEEVSSTLMMYQSLMNSEQQIKEGKVHDARQSLQATRAKYGL